MVFSAKRGGAEVLKKETVLEMEVEACKTSYMNCDVKQSVTRTRLEMDEIMESTGKRNLKDMKEDKCTQ